MTFQGTAAGLCEDCPDTALFLKNVAEVPRMDACQQA